jgi:signal transduction histidine kinase
VVTISSDLHLHVLLPQIVRSARRLVNAQYGALGILGPEKPDDEGRLIDFITDGIESAVIRQIGEHPKGRGILGLLITDPRPLRLRDLRSHAQFYGFPPGHPPMRSFLGVPIRVRGEVLGNLYLAEKKDGLHFSGQDEELVVAFAGAAGLAIENTRLLARVREMALLEDRQRIAHDLHDTVIQRLFAIGVSLQGIEGIALRGDVAGRLRQAVDQLDETIREIRTATSALREERRGEPSVRLLIFALAAEAMPALGFEPRLHFVGPVETIPPKTVRHLDAALQEALANVARHASATTVDVSLEVGADIVLRVVDDGVGMPPEGERGLGQGLARMSQLAQEQGGRLAILGRSEGGTAVEWCVPWNAGSHEMDASL